MDDPPLLIEPDWLEAQLGAADLRIIDATWYLPSEGRDAAAEYAEAHVPGAIHLDPGGELSDPSTGLRNSVASPTQLAATFARAGIGSRHRIAVYDRKGGYSAARIWWTLRYAGHERVGLLHGGFARWQAEGRATTSELPELEPAVFEPSGDAHWLRDKAEIARALEEHSHAIVDARSPARFRGEGPETAARAGHIPGSTNVAWNDNLDGDPPRLRHASELRARYEAAGVRFDRPVITTCGSGVTAAFDAFVLTWLGHPNVAVYDGSWDEWGNDPDTPVESGP